MGLSGQKVTVGLALSTFQRDEETRWSTRLRPANVTDHVRQYLLQNRSKALDYLTRRSGFGRCVGQAGQDRSAE
jgi:hypothetical protein